MRRSLKSRFYPTALVALVRGHLLPDPGPEWPVHSSHARGQPKDEGAFPDGKRPGPLAPFAVARVSLPLGDHGAIGQDPCLLLSNHHQLELVRLAIWPATGEGASKRAREALNAFLGDGPSTCQLERSRHPESNPGAFLHFSFATLFQGQSRSASIPECEVAAIPRRG
jgi:hypothetical protein